ncbi:type IV secretory system conjugative DNA transfer family protein [Pseudoxanthomonas wuyuanensis]
MQDTKTRIWIVLVLLALAALAGLYLSGWLTLMLLGVDAPLEWSTWWKYFSVIDQPRVQPFAGKIKVSGAIGFGLTLLAWLVAAFLLFKPRARALYGEARFAGRSDLSKHKVLDNAPDGIIAATRFGGRFVKVKGKHLLLASPTRSGKGVSTVIPNCLEWQHSMVVLDVKQEAFEKTAGYRAKLGPVFLFDPFTQNQRSHRWNPLGYVSLDPNQRSTDIEAIASSLYKEAPGQDPFWTHSSRGAFQAVCEWLFDNYLDMHGKGWPDYERHYPTLGRVYRLLSAVGAPDEKKQDLFKQLMARKFVGAKAKLGLGNLVSLADETFSSVIATTQAPLRVFGNPVVDAATSDNDFNLHELRRTVQSIYVGVPPSKLVEAKGILNLFFEQAIKLNGSTLPEHDKTLKYQCMFLLDEFTALGEVAIIPVATGWLAGYGVRIVVVIQSVAQLEAVYGAETARGMITNLGCQVIFAPREQRDADEFSKMLGETTVRRKQRTRSYGQGGSRSDTEIIDRRPLMNPDEIKALDPTKAIVLIEGVGHPIMGNKIFYYKDAYFKKRLLEAPGVPKLVLG